MLSWLLEHGTWNVLERRHCYGHSKVDGYLQYSTVKPLYVGHSWRNQILRGVSEFENRTLGVQEKRYTKDAIVVFESLF